MGASQSTSQRDSTVLVPSHPPGRRLQFSLTRPCPDDEEKTAARVGERKESVTDGQTNRLTDGRGKNNKLEAHNSRWVVVIFVL